ncbi:MAG: beta-N-acetylhexosaminidase [Gammaproteobacteria bacterium]|nr:beta-N-acetylhexosaminidase [Gammaproteobacteria bacterium]
MRGPLFVDILGLELNEQDRDLLAVPSVGGVTLFARNFASPSQLTELCAAVHACGDLKVAVDHEGGRVQRFIEGFTRLPGMAAVGAAGPQALDLARSVGIVISYELTAHGLDLSFVPVVDLQMADNLAIGTRAFSADPEHVAGCALALAEGLARGGLPAVAKHFPGHGSIRADSHVELPMDERTLADIERADLIPFRRFADAGAGAIMTAHIRFPAVSDEPATFSPDWIQDVLRGRCGFDGVIFSDDISMQAARSYGSVEDCVIAALTAGCDVALVCNDWDKAMASAERLVALNWQPSENWVRRMGDFWQPRAHSVSAAEYQSALQELEPLLTH